MFSGTPFLRVRQETLPNGQVHDWKDDEFTDQKFPFLSPHEFIIFGFSMQGKLEWKVLFPQCTKNSPDVINKSLQGRHLVLPTFLWLQTTTFLALLAQCVIGSWLCPSRVLRSTTLSSFVDTLLHQCPNLMIKVTFHSRHSICYKAFGVRKLPLLFR